MPEGTRVLAVHHDAGLNGAALLFQSVLDRLVEMHGADVASVFPRPGPLVERAEALGPVEVVGPSSPTGRAVGRKWRWASRTDRAANADVVLANSVASLELLEQLGLPGSRPLALYVHESSWLLTHAGDLDLTRKFLERADVVFVVSEGVRSAIESLEVHPKTVIVAPGHPPKRPNRHEQGGGGLPQEVSAAIARGSPIVGALGTMSWYKGVDLFPAVARRVVDLTDDDVRFVWMGRETEERVGERLAHDLERTGLRDHVWFPGEIADPSDFLEQLDVLLLPSREDSWPLVMLEAASAAVPIVCFARAGGAESFVAGGAGCSVPYLDIDAMARAVVRYLAHPEEAARAGAAGRAAVEAIDPDEQVATIARALASIAAASG